MHTIRLSGSVYTTSKIYIEFLYYQAVSVFFQNIQEVFKLSTLF